MENQLPFFNLSLKRVLATLPDSFARARVKILYTVLMFSLLKILIVVGVGAFHDQGLQVGRAVVAFVLYVVLTKTLLSRPTYVPVITHVLLLFGLVIIWTNIFVYSHAVNITTAQFMFMVVLCSFYTLGTRLGTIYTTVAITPALLFFVFKGTGALYLTRSPQELASPGFEIIVMLNFITIGICHYLFYRAFDANLKEKVSLNEELQLSVAEANRLAQSKSNFLSTVSHELRTPLNAVIGISELLIDDKPEERQKNNLKILHGSAIDLLGLINNVLDYSKLDADKQSLEAIPFSIAEFMHNICSALRIKAADKNLELILQVDNRIQHLSVLSDPTRLSQIMYNLIGNAIKFTDKGRVTVDVSCKAVSGDTAEILFSVTDTGAGIPADKHGSIFELFTQAGNDTSRKYGGTGLGLPIVRQVLSLFGSNVQLESTLGTGSRFFFTIPFTTIAPATNKEVSIAPAAASDFSHLRILIAEDVEINRMIIKRQLDKLGLDAVIVNNGKLAYETFLAADFDVLFIDIHMPVWDGYETIKQVRNHPDPAKANACVVALTASITEGEKILESGFNSTLYKPVQINHLRTKLDEVVSNKLTTYAVS